MKHVILGTAGHIDHGKTALIRALTGIDTDRLKEEKERGISIDLGFAHLELPGDLRLGIVDVPGHERFVKNMLAGAGGIDAVLLVVAADEGVMPQTREHMHIVELLGVRHGVVALTKRDLVDEEWLELAESDVRAFLAPTPLAAAPLVACSATTGEGLPELKAALTAVCGPLPARTADGPARLPVDRVFTVEGFGTVVTGTLWSGRIAVGDRLEVLPAAKSVRVRNVQVHEESVPAAVAGQRTAVALHGVDRGEIERGHVVATPGYFRPVHIVDARLQAVRDLPRPILHRQRVRFHLAANEILGRVVLLDAEKLGPGQSALVEFRLESPVAVQRGDRFVIRQYSPATTIGGGVVVDAPDRKRRRFREEEIESLLTREQGSGPEVAMEHLRQAGLKGISPEDLERAASLAPGAGAGLLEALAADGRALALPLPTTQPAGAQRSRYLDRARVDELEQQMLALLRDHAERYPLRWGMGKEELRSRLPAALGSELFQHLLESLAARGALQLRRERVRGGSGELTLAPGAQAAVQDLLERFRAAAMTPPTVAEISAGWAQRGIALADLLELLSDRGDLTKIAPDLYYLTAELDTARRAVLARLDETGQIGVPDFKALFGITRKWAMPLLEFFDREGTTRRVGDQRVRGKPAGEG